MTLFYYFKFQWRFVTISISGARSVVGIWGLTLDLNQTKSMPLFFSYLPKTNSINTVCFSKLETFKSSYSTFIWKMWWGLDSLTLIDKPPPTLIASKSSREKLSAGLKINWCQKFTSLTILNPICMKLMCFIENIKKEHLKESHPRVFQVLKILGYSNLT